MACEEWGGTDMSDTKSLLTRITAFRERLEKTPPLVGGPGVDPSAVVERIARNALQPAWVSSALRQIAGVKSGEVATVGPSQLISRSSRASGSPTCCTRSREAR